MNETWAPIRFQLRDVEICRKYFREFGHRIGGISFSLSWLLRKASDQFSY
jgi:hypothetical protein